MLGCVMYKKHFYPIHFKRRQYQTLPPRQGLASLRSVLSTLDSASELGKKAAINEWWSVRTFPHSTIDINTYRISDN